MSIELHQPNIVVPATDIECFHSLAATEASAATWDLIEARLDQIVGLSPQTVEKSLSPVLLTARHPDEGGSDVFADPATRIAALAPLVPHAQAIDIEIAHTESMRDILTEASKSNLTVVLSFHDFDATPDRDRLVQIVEQGFQQGADVVKLATRTETGAEVTRMIGILEHFPDKALSVMGMGSLGMASRLLAAGCGSTLNYAAQGKASVEGQWPAAEFRDLLERTGAREPRN